MLSLHDTEKLRRSGFTQFEVNELNHWKAPDGSPQHIDLDTPGWKAAIASRQKYFKKQMKGGMSYPQYVKKIEDIYQKLKDTGEGDDSIATFLRAEYSRVLGRKTDYQRARENRALGVVRKAYLAKARAK